MTSEIYSPTRQLDADQIAVLRALTPGAKIAITQTVRVGSRRWETKVAGSFRHINYLATGLATDRVAEDDIIVPTVHFTKENGELSSIALDENSVVVAV